MSGAAKSLNDCGCILVGGHTCEGPDLSLGFAVNGALPPNATALLKAGAAGASSIGAGLALVLTKPLGTGVVLAAHMRGDARWGSPGGICRGWGRLLEGRVRSRDGAIGGLGSGGPETRRCRWMVWCRLMRVESQGLGTREFGTGPRARAPPPHSCPAPAALFGRGTWVKATTDSMCVSNAAAVPVLRAHGVRACTDVTGFGLAGHLSEMLKGGQAAVDLRVADIPALPVSVGTRTEEGGRSAKGGGRFAGSSRREIPWWKHGKLSIGLGGAEDLGGFR